ncbi:MAG: hypothetical protein J6W82_05205 [Bacteroidales bacterium]|nr:hypothetical protein [Bacteroidales bacterium]
MIKISPCKDCELRHAGCHADCAIYGEWKAERDEEKKQRFVQREVASQIDDLIITNMEKVAKAKRRLRSARKK